MNTSVYIHKTENGVQLVTEDGAVIDNLIIVSFQQGCDPWGPLETKMEVKIIGEVPLWPPSMKTVVKKIREKKKESKNE